MVHRSTPNAINLAPPVPAPATTAPLHRLALMTGGTGRFAINSISVDPSGGLAVAIPPPPSRCRFQIDGLTYALAIEPGAAGATVTLRARLGSIPYTAESADARRAILTILRHCRRLATVGFSVDRHQAIWLGASAVVEDPLTPEAVMIEIVRSVQEARPYLRLIEEYL